MLAVAEMMLIIPTASNPLLFSLHLLYVHRELSTTLQISWHPFPLGCFFLLSTLQYEYMEGMISIGTCSLSIFLEHSLSLGIQTYDYSLNCGVSLPFELIIPFRFHIVWFMCFHHVFRWKHINMHF